MHATRGREPHPLPKNGAGADGKARLRRGTAEGCGTRHHLSELTHLLPRGSRVNSPPQSTFPPGGTVPHRHNPGGSGSGALRPGLVLRVFREGRTRGRLRECPPGPERGYGEGLNRKSPGFCCFPYQTRPQEAAGSRLSSICTVCQPCAGPQTTEILFASRVPVPGNCTGVSGIAA